MSSPPPATATPAMPSRNLLAAPAPARVLLAGVDAQALAPAVTALVDDGGPLIREETHGPRTVDAVVLGRGLPLARREGLEAEAAAHAVPVLSLGRQPVLDVRTINPTGWQRHTAPELGVLLAHPDRTRAWGAVERAARRFGRDRLVLLLPRPWGHVDGRGLEVRRLTDDDRRATVLQGLRGVVDEPALHLSVPERADWLAELAARGVPVLASGLEQVGGRLHEPVEHALSLVTVDDLADPERREAASIRLRRAALRHHGAPGVWRRLAASAGLPLPPVPSVSVLLASKRPDQLPAAVARIDRQHHDRVEIVVALHGDEVPPGLQQELAARTDRPLQLLQVPSSAPLGTVLNRASDAASGELVAKMDDDDLYDLEHLDDLLDALRYSGAHLVGKASEYVYLASLDTTIRRFPQGAERRNRNLAGGTLLLSREDLRHLGGWQAAPRAVDQRLIDDLERAGGAHHRTHGHGFVLCRHDNGHTWDSPVDYFLQQAVAQWRGLALDAAGVR